MVDVVNQQIDTSRKIDIAVAFVKNSGFSKIKSSLMKFLERRGEFTFLVGLDFQTTDPEVLRELKNIADSGFYMKFYCYRGSVIRTATYHPKMYLFERSPDNSTIIIGSSNLTSGGLVNNIEVNIVISAPKEEEIISDAYETFFQLLMVNNRISPSYEFIDHYEELCRLAKRNIKFQTHKSYTRLLEIEEELPRPVLKSKELFGWMKIVYESLPAGKFSTSDIYHHEVMYLEKYPDNRNIRAKIRQQLQFLRNVGLIDNPSRNEWVKK